MFNVSIITFRESLEMLIVILALVAYAGKINKKELFKYIFGGAFSGLVVSIVSGAIIFLQARQLEGMARDLFQGAMMIFLSILILYYMVWMKSQTKYEEINLEQKYNIKATAWGFFFFSFLTVFRESIEIIMFIMPTISEKIITIVIGGIVGLALAIILMILVYKAALKVNFKIVFDILTLILIYIGAVLFGEGLMLLIPSGGEAIGFAGNLIFGVPTFYIFLKEKIKTYIKKN